MKAKLGIAMALSHNAKLLILDEPTSGLDPIARDELLDIFREIIEDGEKSILFSTHITSDLDKCADYIIFIRNGELIANDTKDDLLAKHILIKGKLSELTEDLKKRLISFKPNSYGFSGLILKEQLNENDTFQTEIPNLEDIMVYYNKEAAL
jgi:ABC-2 type transport system ATP-binding protein